MNEQPDPVELDRAECFRLLAGLRVGRMLFTDRTVPMVHPVNFTLDGEDVIVRTGRGRKARRRDEPRHGRLRGRRARRGDHTGWSVVVAGRAEIVNDIDELVALADPARRPWAPGRTAHVIRVKSEQVTGRRPGPAVPKADAADRSGASHP